MESADSPQTINTDQWASYSVALKELKSEGKCDLSIQHRQVKYLNNRLEADHGKLKRLIHPVRGFKTLKTAYSTIKGFEVMRMFRKGQFRAWERFPGYKGEVYLIEKVFGIRNPEAEREYWQTLYEALPAENQK